MNVEFPCTATLKFGDNSDPTFKIGLHFEKVVSSVYCTFESFWSKTDTYYEGLCVTVPDTCWPNDLPEITIRSGTESYPIGIMGAFIYENTFYNIDFEYQNISDTWLIPGYTLTVKRCDNLSVFLPKCLNANNFLPYTSGTYYQWSASPQVEFQHLFYYSANADVWLVPLRQQGTYTFFVKEFPSLGYSVPEPMLPVDPISIKNLATGQIFNMTFFDRITTTDGEISLYRSNDNSLVIGLGIMAIFLVRAPAIYAWGESKWDNQRIDIMAKAHIVNMICQDVPAVTSYIYLDDNNMAQTGSIQTGNEVFKTCWFKHSLSDEFDQYITSEGVLSKDFRFSDANGQEFNYKEAGLSANIYISTNTPQDIYWSCETTAIQ